VRLYTMTGDAKYLQWAERLADYYLSDPDWHPNRLRDHGCEIIGGLGLLLGVESEHYPEKAMEYAKRLRTLFNTILERGRNEDGLMYNEIKQSNFGKRYRDLSDGWGYNYVSYICYDLATGRPYYRPEIDRTLQNMLNPAYKDYPWEGSVDGYADSIEGAIYLLNRIPNANGLQWVNREMAKNVIFADQPLESAELWGTMKLQANGVRTVLMHALMHTQGMTAHPWRRDLKLGAAQTANGVVISLQSDEPWEGIIEFDIPRYRLYMGFENDWPRMNTLPEWYTVEPDISYLVQKENGSAARYSGAQLHRGLAISVDGKMVITVSK